MAENKQTVRVYKSYIKHVKLISRHIYTIKLGINKDNFIEIKTARRYVLGQMYNSKSWYVKGI